MKKQFTEEMLALLHSASNELEGSLIFNKFHMQCEFMHNKRWYFAGWFLPDRTGEIKTIRGKQYIYTTEIGSPFRYEITDDVKELLGL